MGRGQGAGSPARRFAAAEALPRGRVVPVRAKDGIRLHTEVFGPEDGYPIVLAHGITCALRVWAYQIADLSTDYRVIAFDHRGHGKSAVPPRRHRYSLDILAADLDAVLEATLAPASVPSSPDTRWVASRSHRGHVARRRIAGNSGLAERSSTSTNATRRTAAPANQLMVSTEASRHRSWPLW